MAVDISQTLAQIAGTPGAAIGQGLSNAAQLYQQSQKLKLQEDQAVQQKRVADLQVAAETQKLQANTAFGMYSLQTSPEYIAAIESGDTEAQTKLMDTHLSNITPTMEALGAREGWQDKFKSQDPSAFLAMAVQDPSIYKLLNPASDMKEWQMVSGIAKIEPENRTKEQKRVFDALMNRRDPAIQQVKTGVAEIVQTEQILETLDGLDEIDNKEAYVTAISTSADAIREKARVAGNVIDAQTSVKQAQAQASLHLKPRETAFGMLDAASVPGMSDFEYDPNYINPDKLKELLPARLKESITAERFHQFMSSNNLSAADAIHVLNTKYNK